MVTCWEGADILALLYVMFYCVFDTFPWGVLGRVWCLVVSIPDLCLLTYFEKSTFNKNVSQEGSRHTSDLSIEGGLRCETELNNLNETTSILPASIRQARMLTTLN